MRQVVGLLVLAMIAMLLRSTARSRRAGS